MTLPKIPRIKILYILIAITVIAISYGIYTHRSWFIKNNVMTVDSLYVNGTYVGYTVRGYYGDAITDDRLFYKKEYDVKDSLTSSETYSYNNSGMVIEKQIIPGDAKIKYFYDNKNRLIQEVYMSKDSIYTTEYEQVPIEGRFTRLVKYWRE